MPTKATMSDSTSGSAPMPPSEATYVVQALKLATHPALENGDEPPIMEAWIDLATVTVPGRTKRATIIGKALREAGILPTEAEPLRLRVLDARSAHVTVVGLRQRDPELELR